MEKINSIKFSKLNNIISLVEKEYQKEYIFMAYEYNNEYIVIIIPSFKDFCLDNQWIQKEVKNKNFSYLLIDIRYLSNPKKYGLEKLINFLDVEYYIVNPKYEHLYSKHFRINSEKIKIGLTLEESNSDYETSLQKIIRLALNDNSNVVKFLKSLTEPEKAAIRILVAEVGDEGIFSQAKIASKSSISRVAFTRLMSKMKEAEVAKIEFLGQKGTYWKIIDDTLLDL